MNLATLPRAASYCSVASPLLPPEVEQEANSSSYLADVACFEQKKATKSWHVGSMFKAGELAAGGGLPQFMLHTFVDVCAARVVVIMHCLQMPRGMAAGWVEAKR